MIENRKKKEGSFELWLCRQQGVFPKTALRYVLEGLIPYTEANLKLTFRPNSFFNELDSISDQRYSKATIRSAYYAAKRKGLIVYDNDGNVTVSEEAKRSLKPFHPRKLAGAQVLVVFDIPEEDGYKRRWFRLLLKELKFQKVQQSVWVSDYECYEILSAGILEQQLEKCVRVYEARAVED